MNTKQELAGNEATRVAKSQLKPRLERMRTPATRVPIVKVLNPDQRWRLMWFAVARVAANFLDVLGLLGIALLAITFGQLTSQTPVAANQANLLASGLRVTEYEAVLIALGVASIFLVKSFFSIWLHVRTGLYISRLEGEFSRKIAHQQLYGSKYVNSAQENLATFQNASITSASAISENLNARLSVISEGTLIFLIVGIFIFVNPVVTIALALFLFLVFTLLQILVSRRVQRNGEAQQIANRNSLIVSSDFFAVNREIRLLGVQEYWEEKFVDSRSKFAGAKALINSLNSMPRYIVETSLILGIFGFLAGIVVFSDLNSQAVTLGVFLAGGLRLVASLIPLQSAVNQMLDGANRGQEALAVLSKSEETRKTSANQPKEILPPGAADIKFQEVFFETPDGRSVLQNVNFDIRAGSKVAIVGPSGAGKTTSLDLACGFLQPTSGTILIGRVKPSQLLDSAKGEIGIVPQRPNLVSGNLIENISLTSMRDANIDRVAECLDLAGISWLKEHLSVSESTNFNLQSLSGGEIQRLGIARALYKQPRVLFLDEPTSALDVEAEVKISETLDALRDKVTTVLISHRLSVVKNADQIIYMDSGTVVATGTYTELISISQDFSRVVSILTQE